MPSTRSLQKTLVAAGPAAACLIAGFFLGSQQAAHEHTLQTAVPSGTIQVTAAIDCLGGKKSMRATDPAKQWRELHLQPLAPANEEHMRTLLIELAANDPQRALGLAATAPTPRQRELFRNAALQGWAANDPYAAGVWALANVRPEERRATSEALAAGAIAQPDEAQRAFQHLIAADPRLASDHGNALVFAFARAGQYESASLFAAKGPTEFRAAWLCTAFHQWATYQPETAVRALEKISDPAARIEAQAGLYAGWSMSDPASLVAYAQTLSHGDARLQALNDGLAQWVHLDPAAASAWMDRFDPSPDLDAGAAAVAVAPALVARKPEVAASWAESITDPELRANTLLDLLRLWAEHDAAGARNYATSSPALRPETRALALAFLQPSS